MAFDPSRKHPTISNATAAEIKAALEIAAERQSRKGKTHEFKCPQCGKEFRSQQPNARFCGTKCKDVWHAQDIFRRLAYWEKVAEDLQQENEKLRRELVLLKAEVNKD
mgnify:CR=1 FL=1